MTQEVLGIHQLFTFKGPLQRAKEIASLSKLGQLALVSLEGIHILTFPSSASASIFVLNATEEVFVSCKWSPIEFGCFLGVKTASGKVLIYLFEGFKRWKIVWEFCSQAACHFEWFHCQKGNQLFLVISTVSKETKVFELQNGAFVEHFSFPFGFLSFKITDLGILVGCTKELQVVSIDLKGQNKRLLWERLDSFPQLIEIHGSFAVIGMCHGILLLFLDKNESKFFPFPKCYLTVIATLLEEEQLLVFTSECKVFAVKTKEKDSGPDEFKMNSLSNHKDTEFISNTIASIPVFDQKSFEFGNCCFDSHCVHAVVGEDIRCWLLSNVSAKGYHDFFVVTSCDVSRLPQISCNDPVQIGLSTIAKLAFLAERDKSSIPTLEEFPKVAFLLAHLLNNKEEKKKLIQSILPSPIAQPPEPFFNVCTYSGEVLKSPFTLVCSACEAKYKLELKEFISRCILCGFPTWKSKFCA